MLLVISVSLAGAAGAGDAPPPPAAATAGKDDPAARYGQLQLHPEAVFQEQVKGTKELLDGKEPEVLDQLDRLRSGGHLDRRSASAIPDALANARVTTNALAAEILAGKPIPGAEARSMARALGVAADSLTQQASEIETGLSGMPAGGEPTPEGGSSHLDLQRGLVQDLTTIGERLRGTAHGVMENLK